MSEQETKPTPGPWVCHSGMVWHGETPIARMDRVAGNGTSPCERDANAELIAQAPELLARVAELEEAGERRVTKMDKDEKRGNEIGKLESKLEEVEVNYFRTCYRHRYESAPEEQQENWKFEVEDYEYRKSLIEDELRPLRFLEEFRRDSDVGFGTCSEWDECYTDEELLEWCRHNDLALDQVDDRGVNVAIREAWRIEKLRREARECRLRGAAYEASEATRKALEEGE